MSALISDNKNKYSLALPSVALQSLARSLLPVLSYLFLSVSFLFSPHHYQAQNKLNKYSLDPQLTTQVICNVRRLHQFCWQFCCNCCFTINLSCNYVAPFAIQTFLVYIHTLSPWAIKKYLWKYDRTLGFYMIIFMYIQFHTFR